MTNKIKILDKKTINQIAAGEVIERPASVVKELLENSIDANSTKIVIELEHAGRKLIRVTDNGDGISPEDLKLAFEKHSTSKISSIKDVYELTSLGFRGEALASIAAVAWVECVSYDGFDVTGRRIVLDSGVVKSVSEVGCAKGTSIKVKELFHNLPVRYKYLKSDQTELAHIVDVVTHLAIPNHQISFKVVHNGDEILNLPGTRNQIGNLVNVYGKEIVRNLIPISSEDNVDTITNEGTIKNKHPVDTEFNFKGYIGKPAITRSDKSFQSVYVNGRYVETQVINNAIKEAYHTLVMKNRYPVVILFLGINPNKVDINIHPTKLQVRFESEERVYNEVIKTIRTTLQSHDLIPEAEAKAKSKTQTVSLKAITTLGLGQPGYHSQLSIPGVKPRQTNQDYKNSIFSTQSILSTEPQKLTKGKLHIPAIQPLGQLLDTYIIAQVMDGMLIIDQHAVHERIMYEKIKQKYSDSSMSTQELLNPISLELTPKELGFLKTNLDMLRELNFVIDEMGNNNYFVKGIPIILGKLQNPEFIHDIINDLIMVTKEKEPEIIKDKMIQIMACKAAIKAGKPLSIPEINQLLRELYSIEHPYTCAHGRPTIISMSETQLKKMFKRIV